jgi:hypothetical protein
MLPSSDQKGMPQANMVSDIHGKRTTRTGAMSEWRGPEEGHNCRHEGMKTELTRVV